MEALRCVRNGIDAFRPNCLSNSVGGQVASLVSDQRIQLIIHWKGDKHSMLYVRKRRTGEHSHTTQREVVEVVRELARTLPDAQIARVLNRLGCGCGWAR